MIFGRDEMYDIHGRTIVITGANGGLGTALAETLHNRGANLALLDLDADATTEQAEQLGSSRGARGWGVDVRDLESLETTMKEAAEHFGRLDVVIAAAAVADGSGPMLEANPDAWEKTIDVNVNGVWRTFKAVQPYIEEQNGHMMAISSMAAFVHMPAFGPYITSKAGTWALCNQLRLELSHRDVTVGSVHPPFFRTPMVEEVEGHPTFRKLLNDFSGPFELVDIETVVNDILRGIERRSSLVVTPSKSRLTAHFPGLAQKFIERRYFSDEIVEEALEMYD